MATRPARQRTAAALDNSTASNVDDDTGERTMERRRLMPTITRRYSMSATFFATLLSLTARAHDTMLIDADGLLPLLFNTGLIIDSAASITIGHAVMLTPHAH